MSVGSFLDQESVGLILRVYANEPEYVPDRVHEMMEMVNRALSYKYRGESAFKRVDVVVWADPRFNDSDCGKTTSALREAFMSHPSRPRIHISDYRYGDLFCGLLNWAVAHQMRNRVSRSVIASYQARDHMNEQNLCAMIEAMDNGAMAAGIALHELTALIMRGRLANTFAMWDNEALVSVGGFDLRAQKPANEAKALYVRGWSEDQGEVYYPLAGVEEVIPLARLVATYGACIAPILPSNQAARYRVPDPLLEPDSHAKHLKKMGTKQQRQDAHLYYAGFDPTYLEGGILPAYRHQG